MNTTRNKRIHANKKVMAIKLVTGICVLVFGLTACSSPLSISKTQMPTANNSISKLSTVTLKKQDIRTTIEGVAQFQSAKTTGVLLKDISGPLKRVMLNMGDQVTAGQPLMEIDVTDLQKKINNMELNKQRWNIKRLQSKESIETATREVKLSEIELEKAKLLYKAEPNYVNSQNLQKLQLTYEQSQSNLTSAKLSSELLELDIQDEARNLAELKNQLESSVLKAPVSGTVVYLDRPSDGEIVSAGRVMVRIAEPGSFVLHVMSGDAGVFQYIKNAVMELDGKKYDVSVYTPQPGDQLEKVGQDNKTKNSFYLSFVGTTPEINLKDSFKIKLVIEKKNARILPSSVITEDNGKYTVDVLKENRIQTVDVITGLSIDNVTEVINGIDESDKIIDK